LKPPVILHHDYPRDAMLGGANETFKALLDQAAREGHPVRWVDWSEPLGSEANQAWGIHVVGNMARASADRLAAIARPYVVFCNNSNIRSNHVYEAADLVVFLAPDHQRRGTNIENERVLVYPPYIEHRSFFDFGYPRDTGRVLFVGDIQPHKISEDMVRQCPKPLVAIGNMTYRTHAARLSDLGVELLPECCPTKVALAMNRFERYYWRLDRYGCYGRVLLEALLCGMKVDVNRENFGLFKFEWAERAFDAADTSTARDILIQELEHARSSFWSTILGRM
jgi:hypothetical protein